MKSRGLFKLILLPLIFIVACAQTQERKASPIPEEIARLFSGKYTIEPIIYDNPPRIVAVLPFENLTDKEEAFEIVRKSFYNHFSSLNFVDREIYSIDEILKKEGLDNLSKLKAVTPQDLGRLLNADALIYGEITHYDRLYLGLYSHVTVGARLKMVDARSGKILWTAEDKASKRTGGISTSPVGLVMTAISTALNIRKIELLRCSDDLFRDLVKTIPNPPIAEALKPPKITILVQDAVGVPKKAGDVIKVAMEGQPRMRASFDIGTFKKGIPMEEVEPGSYVGTYKVMPADNVDDAIITGYLVDEAGNTSRWIDVLGTVTIDTTPPAVPSGVSSLGRDKQVQLSWKPNDEKDLSGYRIYRSTTPLSGFQPIGDTEFTTFTDKGLQNGQIYFYKIAAFDRAGNESKPSKEIKGIPIAPGPTHVDGTILKDITWYAGASPYIVDKGVIVEDGATLSIEPGTVVQFHGGGLRIRGQIISSGTKEKIITFEFMGSDGEGIIFERTKDRPNVVEFSQIKGARIGITCISSSPRLSNNSISENGIGISIRDSFSKPIVEGNVVMKNRKGGIEVIASASPVIRENIIKENGGHGILCESAFPFIEKNTISNNGYNGIHLIRSSAIIEKNNIAENHGFNISNNEEGAELVRANENWWGTKEPIELINKISGKVDYQKPLSSPFPGGKPFEIPILTGPLKGEISKESYLTTAYSPYIVEGPVTIVNGAIIYIQPGVCLRFNRGDTFIKLENGAIYARGTKLSPIRFTSNSQSPSRGDYKHALVFSKDNPMNSFFSYCIFEYASTAIVVNGGSPDITYSLISDNLQSGIIILNDSKPKISYSTIVRNLGQSAIITRGNPQPMISKNNFEENAFSIQNYSHLFIDARQNWWGKAPPEEGQFLGNVQLEPWLEKPVEEAFGGISK